jgi:hypothetical protein
MDPWLEHPALWPDVHNRLIASIADAMAPALAPKYFIGLEQRIYHLSPSNAKLIGIPDLTVTANRPEGSSTLVADAVGVGVIEVEIPSGHTVRETYLEVREVSSSSVVTVIEILSRVNKLSKKGRAKYERKRQDIFDTRTNLVEIDLLREGKPMPYTGPPSRSDYRILVSRESRWPRAQLYTFGVRNEIPIIPLPLLPEDAEPPMDLGKILHDLQDRARYDLRLDYTRPAQPPLDAANAAWMLDLAR